MSESKTPEHNPARGREDRADTVRRERRRRKGGNLDRMVQFKLDIFDTDQLDKDYVYRWVNDENSRTREAYNSDYDFVGGSEIPNFSADVTDSESDERIRMQTGKDKYGNATFAYLMKKPRDWWEADQEEQVSKREDTMRGVVYNGEVDKLDGATSGDNIYAAAGNQLGGAAQRRRGPITKT